MHIFDLNSISNGMQFSCSLYVTLWRITASKVCQMSILIIKSDSAKQDNSNEVHDAYILNLDSSVLEFQFRVVLMSRNDV